MKKYLSKAHQEVTEAKMKTVAQFQKSPKNWDKIDKQIQEHFDAHNQVNPNRHPITLEQFRNLISKLELETGLTRMEIVRNMEYILQQRKEHSEYLMTLDNTMTKQEALKFIDQLIKKKVEETGGTKMLVSIEMFLDFEDLRQAEHNQKLKQDIKIGE
ncbi:MAG TPA: hypothetical protein DCR40_08410 [Prolixibacteraceae bacterium]|nr:hypothetical protein [Prolixibacteraceae bacterium]